MKSQHFTSLLFITLLLLSSSFFTSCGEKTQSQDKPKVDSLVVVPVEASTIVSGSISAFYNATAKLEAENEAIISSHLSGVLESVLVEEGDKVKEGQVIARLDNREYVYQINRSQASLEKLKNDFNRSKDLFDKGLISSESYDNIRFQYEQQKADLELAKLNLSYTEVKATISGVISKRNIKQGNRVTPTESLFTITKMDPLLAIVYLPEHELGKIKPNQKAAFKVDAFPKEVFNGYVMRISPTVDAQTGTVKITLAVSDLSEKLRPGMFTRVQIEYDKHLNTALVEKQAVILEDGNEAMYVVKNGMTQKVTVKTGFTEFNKIEILSEKIALGDTVVTVGQNSLKDSSKVQIVSLSK